MTLLGWHEAHALASAAVVPLPARPVRVAAADGLVLAADVRARSDLPAVTASAMDGWAVCGPPPWTTVGVVDAGYGPGSALRAGECVRIATGAPVPVGTAAVLRDEDAAVAGPQVDVAAGAEPPQAGRNVRLAGTECRAGDVVGRAGQRVGPPLIGLLAASGADVVDVVPAPTVALVVTGDELVGSGPASGASVRDALGPMLPAWLRRAGSAAVTLTHVDDSAAALRAALDGATADLVVTTGSTAAGRRDQLRGVLADIGAEILVDGVAVRPGRPMLLARLADGRLLAGLPGNPLAAVSALVTLVLPLQRGLAGRPPAAEVTVVLAEPVTGHPAQHRLVPVAGGRPLHHVGPAMLRGLALADGLALVPPAGADAGDRVRVLPLD